MTGREESNKQWKTDDVIDKLGIRPAHALKCDLNRTWHLG